ncbi:SPOR domain-containing protein [Lysobacter arvi]|uniref:SPOR domain-containing protein n=1 Tax=Lysobacter arvi TaxID=3038776 RepID=A0ABU1CFG8_9GAMM|nr:SPOR domain-containing protein [Lysobacter arvi]MDR0183703.1 SPOR domain-containing protein [Lysobacter arvi]
MLARALVVLLLVLNIGVAAWWMLRAPPAATPDFVPPADVARLQLVGETQPTPNAAAPRMAAPATSSTPAAATPAPPTPANVAAPDSATANARCYSVGPFADSAAASNARDVLMAVATRVVPREQRTGSSARGWRVILPAAASPEEATATAQRIAAAGFDDYFIVRQGAEANSIALGRYRSEEGARRRADTLIAAGFPARAEPLGDGRTNVWLDLVAKPEFDPARAEAAVLVPARELDCARVR